MYCIDRLKNLEAWQKNLVVLWMGIFISWASYTMLMPFLPMYLLLELNVPQHEVARWAGLSFSATFFTGMIMAPYWGARADKVGKKKISVRAGFSVGILYTVYSIITTPEQLVIVRALHGVVSGFVATCLSLAADSLPREKVGWGLGLLQAAGSSGSILGPLLGGTLGSLVGMRMSFVVGGLMFLSAAVCILLFVKEEKSSKKVEQSSFKESFAQAYGNRPLLHMLLLVSVLQMSAMFLQPILPMHIINLQGDATQAVFISGLLFSASGISGMLAAPFWGNYGQKWGFTKTLSFILLAAGLIQSLQAFTNTVWLFGLVQLILGVFLAGVMPSINANIVQFAGEDFRGRAFGLSTSFSQLGGMLGPIIGGWFVGLYSIQVLFIIVGVLLVASGLSVILVRR